MALLLHRRADFPMLATHEAKFAPTDPKEVPKGPDLTFMPAVVLS